MVNLDTHRIIDIIDTREIKQVEEWLKTYPNLEIISRDGAITYSSVARNAHPSAIQVSDRFHLLKNLSDAVEKYMYRLDPSRLVIPATVINPEPYSRQTMLCSKFCIWPCVTSPRNGQAPAGTGDKPQTSCASILGTESHLQTWNKNQRWIKAQTAC